MWLTMKNLIQSRLMVKVMKTETVFYDLCYNAVEISVDQSAKNAPKILEHSLIIRVHFLFFHWIELNWIREWTRNYICDAIWILSVSSWLWIFEVFKWNEQWHIFKRKIIAYYNHTNTIISSKNFIRRIYLFNLFNLPIIKTTVNLLIRQIFKMWMLIILVGKAILWESYANRSTANAMS